MTDTQKPLFTYKQLKDWIFDYDLECAGLENVAAFANAAGHAAIATRDKELLAGSEEPEIVAYASSHPVRLNQLMSARQFDNCLPKNRVEFDLPLITVNSHKQILAAAVLREREKLPSLIDYWVVFDDQGLPIHITLTSGMAHEHIKGLQEEFPEDGFGKFSVKPVSLPVSNKVVGTGSVEIVKASKPRITK